MLQSYLTGFGFSSVFGVSLRAITKAAFTDSSDGLRISAYTFFFSASLMCLGCLVAQRCIVVPAPILKERPQDEERPLIKEASEERQNAQTLWYQGFVRDYANVVGRLKLPIFNMVAIFSVTLTIFPGVPSDVKVNAACPMAVSELLFQCKALGSWYGVMLVAVFATGDFAGRLFPTAWYVKRAAPVTTAVVARVILIPITFIAVQSFSNPFSISVLLHVLGLSGG